MIFKGKRGKALPSLVLEREAICGFASLQLSALPPNSFSGEQNPLATSGGGNNYCQRRSVTSRPGLSLPAFASATTSPRLPTTSVFFRPENHSSYKPVCTNG
ncbi:unnamed protein product [Citrullus colocynthis]|uniref:Uncharacterized protein n=1 Tax=Citrullus colocynthis TaxID=252529 RepID=A0ABP0Y254_9ROSI